MTDSENTSKTDIKRNLNIINVLKQRTAETARLQNLPFAASFSSKLPVPQEKDLSPQLPAVYGGPVDAKNSSVNSLLEVSKKLSPELSSDAVEILTSFVDKVSKGPGTSLPMRCEGDRCPFLHVCQPPGTMVLTSNRGYVKIENLIPEMDTLIPYSFRQFSDNPDGCRDGLRLSGRNFTITPLFYNNNLIKITAGQFSHKTTLNHQSIVRWNEKAIGKFAVYLMQKGNFFRVGKTQLILRADSKNPASGPISRATSQEADKLWILGVYETNTEALLAEDYYSVSIGASKCEFIVSSSHKKNAKWNGLCKWVTQEQLDDHHLKTSKPLQHYHDKLAELGLDLHFPFWDKNNNKGKNTSSRGSLGRAFPISGCNLISDIMSVGILEEVDSCNNKVEWVPIKVERESYEGLVYNLDVEVDHTYIANNIVTHNCPLYAAKITLPVGHKCPVEANLVALWVNKHLMALGIDNIDNPENSFDMDMLYELATQELIRYRCSAKLSENPNLVENKQVGESFTGNPIFADVINPVLDVMEKAGRNIAKIREALLATRRAQLRVGEIVVDATEKAAELRRKAMDISKSRLGSQEKIKPADYTIIEEDDDESI